ncbi:protein SPT2 homolog [Penaeus monodon]|uniref:protein SPT2 homolog n=1 Tax=Penaeus monodon TaxID=6687 RepID=UPI0018A6ECFD|nr:protein SPT2 homolog [Penaeus monodon]
MTMNVRIQQTSRLNEREEQNSHTYIALRKGRLYHSGSKPETNAIAPLEAETNTIAPLEAETNAIAPLEAETNAITTLVTKLRLGKEKADTGLLQMLLDQMTAHDATTLMTAKQKCLPLTAVVLVAVVSPAVAISALSFPLFSTSNTQEVRQVSADGASLQEQTENGRFSGTCSFEDESGRTIEVIARDDCGSQDHRPTRVGDFTFIRENNRGQSSYNTGRYPTQYQGAGQNSYSSGRYPSQNQGAGQNSYSSGRYPSQNQGAGQSSYNTGRYPSQNQGAGQNSYSSGRYPSQNQGAGQSSHNTGRYPSQNQGAGQSSHNTGRYPSQNQGAGQNSYNTGRYPSQNQGAGQNSYSSGRYPSQNQGAGQSSHNTGRYPSQNQGGYQASGKDTVSSSQHQGAAQSSYNGSPHRNPGRVPTTTQAYDRHNYPSQGQSVTRPSYGGNTSPNHAQATTQSFTDNDGVTQAPFGNANETTQSSSLPSFSGTGSQSSPPRRNDPGRTQMVFQTSHGNSMQFQENTNRGVTTGQCSYVDWRGRTINISYTKHADGKVDVVTDPEVWQPKAAYRNCVRKAKEEEKKLNNEMAEIEADLRQQEQELQSDIARQESEAFGRGK